MDARALSCPTARLCRPFLRRPGARASRQQYRGLACAVDRGPGRVLEADGRAGALSGLCPLEFRGPPADPPSGLRARLERPRRGSTEGRLRAVDALGDEPALSVRRCHARRLEEFSTIQGCDARAVLFRRSLGDAAGGRTAVFGIYLDHAGNPHGHARRRGSEKDRPSRLFPWRTPGHAVARRRGVVAGGVSAARCNLSIQFSNSQELRRHRPRRRATQYPRDAGDCAVKPRRTGSPAFAGDDDRARLRVLATPRARVLLEFLAPSKNRGRRECRMLDAPAASRAKKKKTHAHSQGPPKSHGIPCAMVLTAPPWSPWCTGLVSHHRLRKLRPAS